MKVAEVKGKYFYDTAAEVVDTIFALIIGAILLIMVVVSIVWCSDATKNFLGNFTGSLLYSLKNLVEAKVVCVYALFCIHKIILAALLTDDYETDYGFAIYHSICFLLSFAVSLKVTLVLYLSCLYATILHKSRELDFSGL